MLNLPLYSSIRNISAPELVELFLVGAVAAVLGIRWFLALTGYPQIGGAGLHIAHLLWGGLLLLVALLLLFATLGRAMQRIAALLGGVGFGAFIDELGKFITADHNYFYQPTIGLIYVAFIGIFLGMRGILVHARLTPEAALANALTLLASASGGRPDTGSRREILRLLARADTTNPLVTALDAYVRVIDAAPDSGGMGWYFSVRRRLAQWYRGVALHRLFRAGLLAFFALYVLAHFGMAVYFAVSDAAAVLTFNVQAQLASSFVAAAVAAYGISQFRRYRADAYRAFTRATLLNILVTQVFAFLDAQLAALGGLVISLLIYAALRYMTEQEAQLTYDNDRAAAIDADFAGRSNIPSLSSGECG